MLGRSIWLTLFSLVLVTALVACGSTNTGSVAVPVWDHAAAGQ